MSALCLVSAEVLAAAVTRVWVPLSIGFAAQTFGPVDSFGLSWQWWIYGWLVYEFWYWFQHWAAHKDTGPSSGASREERPLPRFTREVDTGSFWDVHVQEFLLLARDVGQANAWGDKLRYLVMPPGWAPGDASHTAANQKRAAAL